MSDVILALDQGTTGTTALVFTHDGSIAGRGYSEFTQHYPEPGWVEHDAQEIWDVSCRVMAEALAAADVQPSELVAIGITNQRETTVVWDRATGRPVHPAIVWQSRQTVEICEALQRDGHEDTIRTRTGLVTDAYFSGTKIAWILDRYPEARAKAEDGEVLFGTIDSWLVWKLTGGSTHVTDPTNASRTLLYNIHDQRWDPVLQELLGVPSAMLPRVMPSCSRFGETRGVAGIRDGVPIAGIAGDQQAALYGQGCFERGQAKNTYGTGCFILMNMGDESPISKHGLLTTICCTADGQPAYALEGAIFVAGAAIQWLRDELGLIEHAADSEVAARRVPDTHGAYVVPAFAGLGAPYWDMNARGAIVGLTRGVNRDHIIRATLESLAFQTRDVIEAMNADSGIPIAELRVDGGAAANDLLMQFQADLLAVSVDRPAVVETTATGAAFLAGLAVGFWSSPDELRHVRRRERLFEPDMEASTRDALYDGWKQAVARVRTG